MTRLLLFALILGSYLPSTLASPLVQVSKTPARAAQKTAANPWVRQLRDADPKKRAKAAHEIGKSGDVSALPALVAALTDPSPKVRREVVLALASFRLPQALNGLIQATTDSDDTVRDLAIQAVVGYYTGESPNAGVTGFMVRQYRMAKRRYELSPDQVDPGTVVDPRAVSALDAAMMDMRHAGASREAAKGLGILDAKSSVPDLIRAAHSGDEGLALEALNSLSKIKDPVAGPQLLDLLNSSNQDVQREAAVTVGILRTTAALPRLQALYLNDRSKETREKALEGLAFLGDRTSVPLLIKALWSEDKSLSTYAAEGLARAGDARALPDLEKAVGVEKNASARLAMQFAITAMGKDDYVATLVNTLSSTFHADAAQSYLIELARKPEFLAKLYPYLSNNNAAIRRRLALVLMYAGDRSSLAPLERLSKDRNSDVAAAALRALRAVRARTGATA